jgi:predicted O-methyltransferase YrrM
MNPWVTYAKQKCFTWTEDETLDLLASYAKDAGYMVESGTYMGASAMVMLGVGVGHLWCVDKFMVAGTEFVTRYNLSQWIKNGRCELIIGDSERAGSMLAPHMTGKVDLIWVDDGHATEDVLRDIRCLKPLLKPGGVMLGHDWEGNNDVALGVKKSGIAYDLPLPRVWRHVTPRP